jgi:hypothetical protein
MKAPSVVKKCKKLTLAFPFLKASRQLLGGASFAPHVLRFFFVGTRWLHGSYAGRFLKFRKAAGPDHASPKVSDAQYQLLSNSCQEKNAKCR